VDRSAAELQYDWAFRRTASPLPATNSRRYHVRSMAAPLVSIIVPTYNRPDALAACVQTIGLLDYPSDRVEVLIVDDGSSIDPRERLASVRGSLKLELLCQPHGGPAQARNLAARHARGDFLVFIDDDCRVPADFLQRVSAQLQVTPNAGIGGQTLNVLDNVYSIASQVHVEYLYSYYNAVPECARFFSSNNLALPAEGFRQVGGFDATFMTGEDREFCDRWLSAGLALRYCPDVHVYHAHVLTFASFWWQHFNYGRGSFRFRQRYAERRRRDMGLERISFYLNLLRWRSSQVSGLRAVAVSLLLAVSQLATAAGFLWERIAGADHQVR
jgi:GT2 family glycosyltransferase